MARPMLPGRPHEGESPGGLAEAPREMAAGRASVRSQNPAYRPAPPFLAPLATVGAVRKRIEIAVAGALVVTGAVLAWLGLTGGGPAVPSPGVVATSTPLPPVSGTTLEGAAFSVSRFRGHVLVLNFWNPYCAPCRAEATVLDLAEGALAPKGVVIAGVLFSNANFPHDVAAARRFARELGERYPTIDDPGDALARAFGIRGIPTTVIADSAGRIRFEVFGALKRGELERLVRRLRRR